MSVHDFLNKAEKTTRKASEVTEKKIENTFVKYAKKLNCWAVKLVLLAGRGWPDRTCLFKGHVFFIEFKRKGKKPTDKQDEIRKKLQNIGFKYYVCDQIGQAEKILNQYNKGVIPDDYKNNTH